MTHQTLPTVSGKLLYINDVRYNLLDTYYTEEELPQIILRTNIKNFVFDNLKEMEDFFKKHGPLVDASLLPANSNSKGKANGNGKDHLTPAIVNKDNEPFQLSSISSEDFSSLGKMQMDILKALRDKTIDPKEAKEFSVMVKSILSTVQTELKARRDLQKLPGQ